MPPLPALYSLPRRASAPSLRTPLMPPYADVTMPCIRCLIGHYYAMQPCATAKRCCYFRRHARAAGALRRLLHDYAIYVSARFDILLRCASATPLIDAMPLLRH